MKRIFRALVTLAVLTFATAIALLAQLFSLDALFATIPVVEKVIGFSIASAIPIGVGLLLAYRSKRAIREHQTAFMSASLVAGLAFTDWSVGLSSLQMAGVVLWTVLQLGTLICLPVTFAESIREYRNSAWQSREPADRD